MSQRQKLDDGGRGGGSDSMRAAPTPYRPVYSDELNDSAPAYAMKEGVKWGRNSEDGNVGSWARARGVNELPAEQGPRELSGYGLREVEAREKRTMDRGQNNAYELD